MQNKNDFLGSQHLGRDQSGEKPAMWGAEAGGGVRGTAGVHFLGRSRVGVSEEQGAGEEGSSRSWGCGEPLRGALQAWRPWRGL